MANVELPAKAFLLPTVEQSGSRLLSLPTELRTEILRLLVKNRGNILPLVSTDTAANYHLSSQVLRCCQSLYHEAHHMLYQENTLAVVCKDGKPSESISILDCIVYLPGEPLSNANTVDDLVSAARRAVSIFPSKRGSYERLCRIYPSLSQFSHVCVTLNMRIDSISKLSSLCRCLRGFVTQKQVAVDLSQLQHSMKDTEDILRCFRWWSCRSIRFSGLHGYEIKDVVSIVACSSFAVDLFKAAIVLQCMITNVAQQIFTLNENQELEAFTRIDWDGYKSSIYHNDIIAFQKIANEIVELKKQATDCAVKAIKAKVEKEVSTIELIADDKLAELKSEAEDEIVALEFQAKTMQRKVEQIVVPFT